MKKPEYTDKPNFLFFWFIYYFCKRYFGHLIKREFTFEGPKEELFRTPAIVISNHAVYTSFVSAGMSMRRFPHIREYNGAVGDVHFGNDIFGFMLEKMNSIPIKQYVADLPAVFNMARCIRAGHRLLLFPEGISSYCGITQPIFPSTASFIKEMKADVILVKNAGEFLISPRFCGDKRKGLVETRCSRLFTAEELESINVSEIEERLADALRYNDFAWNEERCFHYRGKYPCATGLEKILYYCPKCGSDGTLFTKGELVICRECGNTVRCDDTYAITPNGGQDVLPYKRIDEWYADCRKRLRQKIRLHEDTVFSFDVQLNAREKGFGKPKFKRVGEGTLTIDRTGTKYAGTENGQEIEIFIPIIRTLGASIQNETYLVTYDKSRMIAFEFVNIGSRIIKAEAAIEEFHALADPDWNRALCRAYYPEELTDTINADNG